MHFDMIQLFKTKKETTMTTKFTKHLSPLAELLTFKVQWCGKIIEQDFDNILLEYYDGKIDISSFHRNEYDENLEPEPLGFYSAPLFVCSEKKADKINDYFKANNYPLEVEYYKSSSFIYINGFGNLFGQDKVIPLETIIDDVLNILLSEDESENK